MLIGICSWLNTCPTIQVISKQQFQKQNSKQILFEIKIWVGNKNWKHW
jgi:hypothetical protein